MPNESTDKTMQGTGVNMPATHTHSYPTLAAHPFQVDDKSTPTEFKDVSTNAHHYTSNII